METAAREFYASSKFLKNFDMQRFSAVWASLLGTGAGAIFLLLDDPGSEVLGALGGVVYPDPYSGDSIATEFFFFVREKSRGQGLKLYKLFEDWAKERGCLEVRMVHLTDLFPEQLDRLYRRLGFEPAEVHYVKRVAA